MISQDDLKRAVAQEALLYVPEGEIIGVGTGSTARFFIDALATIKSRIQGAVASSEDTKNRLMAHGIPVFDLNAVDSLAVYIDGADEINGQMHMIKGGGGALTREKIVAAVAQKFICLIDESKKVAVLGNFALPVEVIPLARHYVWRKLVELGAKPVWREGRITDNGNHIIDAHGLKITDPCALETDINQIVGVVTNGLFAKRAADICLMGTKSGVITLRA